MNKSIINIGLFGTVINNGNMGCVALTYSVISLLEKVALKIGKEFNYTLFDMMPDKEKTAIMCENIDIDSDKIRVVRVGNIENIKRCIKYFYRNVKMMSAIKKCDVIIDITEGDSFTDIYGEHRFYSGCSIKKLVEKLNVPLILGPQTYGPFNCKKHSSIAKEIIENASLVIARDAISKKYISKFSNKQVYETTDMAFSLPYMQRKKCESEKIQVGINISSLLICDKKENTEVKFAVKTDYDKYIDSLLSWLNARRDKYEIHLIPHVIEDDYANHLVKKKYENMNICDMFHSPIEAKSYISGMDIFIGARMHATIAGVSAGIPTIPVAYSRKFTGLFESIEYPYVIDLSLLNTEESIGKTINYMINYKEIEKTIKNSYCKIERKVKKNEEIFAKFFDDMLLH